MKALLLILALLVAGSAFAQVYPAKPVRMVVPYPPGGTTDTVARLLAQKLTEAWQQPVLVENRPGAGGNVGADAVARAAPDGHTFLYAIHGLAISHALYRKLPFDASRDFLPVSQLASTYLVLAANAALPAESLRALLALAKSRPGQLTYGTGGVGVPGNLGMELLKMLGGVDILHVPYKGDAPAIAALVAGEVNLSFSVLAGLAPHLKTGKIRALAVSSAKRSPALPEVPTAAEAGLPGFDFTGWVGLFLPAQAPMDVARRIQADAAKSVFMPDIRDRMPGWGYEPVGSTPEEFAARFRSDLAMYARIVKQAKLPRQE
jgi:tripartite-type tricarboxylate transporter receptor subunit TctC